MINFLKPSKTQVSFFAVFKKENPDAFLTITVKKQEAIEYALKILKLEHLSHFQAWCMLRDYDYNSQEPWDIYFQECISEAEKSDYIISKISYNMKDIAAIIRMFGSCAPLGCSYDTPVEYEYAKAQAHQWEIHHGK